MCVLDRGEKETADDLLGERMTMLKEEGSKCFYCLKSIGACLYYI